jgi:hypothetical protein
MQRRSFTAGLASTALAGAWTPRAGAAEKVLRVAMTAAGIPITTGQPNQGSERIRFAGVTAYDALGAWDLSRGDIKGRLKPAWPRAGRPTPPTVPVGPSACAVASPSMTGRYSTPRPWSGTSAG